MVAGALGITVGMWGMLRPCDGSCANTVDAETGTDLVIPALAGGGALLLIGLVLLVWAIVSARQAVPIETSSTRVGQEPVRICPRCSTQSRTAGEYCPHCGAAFTRSAGASTPLKVSLVAVTALLALAGATAGFLIYKSGVEDEKAERIELAEDYQAEQERARAEEAKLALEEAEADDRESTLREIEREITKDMRKRSQEEYSIVDGPILGTQCTPEGGEEIADIEDSSVSLDCLAYNKQSGTRLSGTSVSSTVNFDSGEYTWQLGQD